MDAIVVAIFFGGLIIFAVLTLFISIIIYSLFRYSKNKKIAVIFSLCSGVIGFIGLLMVFSAIDWQTPVLWFGFLIPVSWLIVGIIGILKTRKEERSILFNPIVILLLLFVGGAITLSVIRTLIIFIKNL